MKTKGEKSKNEMNEKKWDKGGRSEGKGGERLEDERKQGGQRKNGMNERKCERRGRRDEKDWKMKKTEKRGRS